MTLIVHELVGTIAQTVSADRNTIVEAIRPHIYKHGNPPGSLTIQVQDENGDLICESEPVSISDVSNATYFHGYIKFDINAYLKKETNYRIALVASGYSFSESAYIGWVTDFDLSKYPMGYTPSNDFSYPLDMEIWERKP